MPQSIKTKTQTMIINLEKNLDINGFHAEMKQRGVHFFKEPEPTNVANEIALSGFYIMFDGSTVNEKPNWFGISHLMEHLVCKSIDHLMDTFQTFDIQWNAYTSNTEVVFYMTGLDRYVNEYKEAFLKFILSYNLTDEQLQNEKKIVLEEYKDAFNSQNEAHYLNLIRKKFGYYTAIGLRSDIENFTFDDCQEYLDRFFRNPTKIINVSKFNPFQNNDIKFLPPVKTVPFTLADDVDIFKITSDDKTSVPEFHLPIETINNFKNKSSIINMSPIITEKFAEVSFLCAMLGSGLNSPLYKEVREKLGLVYYIQCFNDRMNNISSVILISTETSNKNVKTVQKQIRYVLDNKEKFLTQERFQVIKDNFKARFEKAEILNYTNIKKYLDSDEWLVEKIIDTITLQDVYDLVDKHLQWKIIYKSIDKTEFK